jgi:hypothetical protein
MRTAVGIVLVCAAFTACSTEEFVTQYSTVADLHKADAGVRTRMPAWLPSSATEIREWHSANGRATLVAFKVPSVTRSILTNCRAGRLVPLPPPTSWWPSSEDFDRLDHFTCDEPAVSSDGRAITHSAGAAIDRETDRVYFWRSDS